MSEIWLTSDLHFGHPHVARLRGFDDVDDHDKHVVGNLSRMVRHRDELFVLGDLSVGRLDQALALMASVPGTKHLILGNHDAAFPGARGHRSAFRRYLDVFATVALHGALRTDHGQILLSHFPYEGDHGPDRFTQWRLRDNGFPVVHGHTHGPERLTTSGAGSAQVHVGLDAWDMGPASVHDVTALIGRR